MVIDQPSLRFPPIVKEKKVQKPSVKTQRQKGAIISGSGHRKNRLPTNLAKETKDNMFNKRRNTQDTIPDAVVPFKPEDDLEVSKVLSKIKLAKVTTSFDVEAKEVELKVQSGEHSQLFDNSNSQTFN